MPRHQPLLHTLLRALSPQSALALMQLFLHILPRFQLRHLGTPQLLRSRIHKLLLHLMPNLDILLLFKWLDKAGQFIVLLLQQHHRPHCFPISRGRRVPLPTLSAAQILERIHSHTASTDVAARHMSQVLSHIICRPPAR